MLVFGAFSTQARLSDAVMLAAPLVLCAAGITASVTRMDRSGPLARKATVRKGFCRWIPSTMKLAARRSSASCSQM